MDKKQTKNLCFLNLSDSDVPMEPKKVKKTKGKLFSIVDIPDATYIDVNIENLASGRYELNIPDDIYGSGFPLHGMDGKLETVPFKGSSKRVSAVKGSSRVPDGSAVKGSYVDATNYFNVELKPVPKEKPKTAKYRTIVRKRNGKIQQQRYKVSESDYKLLTGKVINNVKTRVTCVRSGVKYLTISGFHAVIAYLASVSLEQLYTEKIRSRVNCIYCGKVSTLTAYENKLTCVKCWHSVYNLQVYRIRFFYVNSFERYELNELTGIVRKQVETSRGFRTTYQGSLNL